MKTVAGARTSKLHVGHDTIYCTSVVANRITSSLCTFWITNISQLAMPLQPAGQVFINNVIRQPIYYTRLCLFNSSTVTFYPLGTIIVTTTVHSLVSHPTRTLHNITQFAWGDNCTPLPLGTVHNNTWTLDMRKGWPEYERVWLVSRARKKKITIWYRTWTTYEQCESQDWTTSETQM